LTISLPIEYCKGSLNDVSKLKFAEGLSVSGESTEFNVLCMDHKFWVAVQADAEIGIIVLGRGSQNELRIMDPEVAPARKNGGCGFCFTTGGDCTLSRVQTFSYSLRGN
jgi:hypothetical protein